MNRWKTTVIDLVLLNKQPTVEGTLKSEEKSITIVEA